MRRELVLDQMEVQELSQEDLKKIDGGISPFLLLGGISSVWAVLNMLFN